MVSWLLNGKTPLLVAHRGASAVAPENTLIAFSKAIELKADAIELDVRLSSDGKVVVIHDSRLERTTDGRGRVSAKTALDLKTYSAGVRFGRRFSAERIPLLREVFELNKHRVGLNIEIKQNPLRRSRVDIVEECIRLAREYHAIPEILISSFHYRYVKRAKLLEPKVAAGVLLHSIRKLRRPALAVLSSNHADVAICSTGSLTKKMVRKVHESGHRVGVYTVDDAARFRKLAAYGVDFIITNDITHMRDAAAVDRV